jgi:hypothetical protein
VAKLSARYAPVLARPVGIGLIWLLPLVSPISSSAGQLPVDLKPEDQREVNTFLLTVATLQKALEMNESLVILLTKDRPLRLKLATEARTVGVQSIAEAVRRLEARPEIMALLQRAGLESRLYIVSQLALVQASVTAENVKSGLAKRPRPDAGALAQNVAFVEVHSADIRRFMQGVERITALLDQAHK